jgi:acetyl coenzyme A synthetase (ADP forming)-like protein
MPNVEFPAHLEADFVLRDGSTVRIRPARREDETRIEDYLIGLSPETRRLRFWSSAIDVRDIARRAADVDYVNHLTLLAVKGGHDGEVVGGAQYIRSEGDRAEMSVSVADHMQRKGLGSILIGELAQAAGENGIPILWGEVLPENHRMVNMLRKIGFTVSIRATPGAIEIEFPTSMTDEAVERFEERGATASVNAMRTFLAPAAVAVIGASRDPETIGGRLFRNLLGAEYAGVVHPVNPNAGVVQGVRTYPSVLDAPGDVDVAFIAVPAQAVSAVARECGDKGVHGLVVISSGFAEIGGDGPDRQRELVEICRAYGMRLIGPNCMGLVNTDPEVRLNGTFATVYPPAGNVGFLSQSGALGLAVMSYAADLGVGLSSFVSVGNKGDISGNDLISFWDSDPRTDVILLYLESFGNPRRFAYLARRIGKRKPIVVVKSGRSAAGQRATASHTGALLAASDVTVDALFHQSGVIRTETLEEMFDVATLLANQPPPAGDRVAIVTNAGGLGILCTDTCEAHGLSVPPLAEQTVAALRSFLPDEASVANPVDMIASATGQDYGRTIRTVAEDPGIDAVIVIYIPPLEAQASEVASNIVAAIGELGGAKPVLTNFMSAKGLPEQLRDELVRIPSYAFPEQAAIALARAAAYGKWRARPEGEVPAFPDVRADEATGIIAGALERGPGWLSPEEVERLLACYGLAAVRQERVATPEEAAEALGRIGSPVALKAVGGGIVHKTDVGAVALDLRDPGEILEEAGAMADRVAAHGLVPEGFLVQEMVPGGVEMLVGVTHDRLFGPVVACGAGGTAVELMRDVSVRIAPLTDLDASEMLRSLVSFPLLDGFRGAPKMDVAALEEMLLRVSALAEAHPEIMDMDCNPVMALPKGTVVVDARVRVEQPPPPKPLGARGG